MSLMQFPQKLKSKLHRRRQLIYSNLLFRWILYAKSRPMTISKKSTLVFAPHPDDETLGCGGMIALKREQKVPVEVVFITDGQASHPNHPRIKPEQLIQIRKQEAVTALAILGVEPSQIHFLDQQDGSLSNLPEEERQQLLDRLIQLLQDFNPQEVYVSYRKDGHPDHETTSALVQAAILKSKLQIELLQYPIDKLWNPWLFDFKSQELANSYRLPLRHALSKKKQALEAYPSQFLPLAPDTKPLMPQIALERLSSPYEVFFRSSVE